MVSLMRLGLGLGLAGAAGARTYFPLIVMGLLTRFSETMGYRAPFKVFSSMPVLVLLVGMAVYEMAGERMARFSETNQVLLAVSLRALGGAILFAGTYSGFGILGGIIAGAVVAVSANLIMVRLRSNYGRNAGARSGVMYPAMEEAAAVGATILALLLPWSSYIIWGGVLLASVKKIRESGARYGPDTKAKPWR